MCNQFAGFHKWAHAHPKHRYYSRHARRKWAKRRGFGLDLSFPPVNVQELDDRFEFFLFAPGLAKNDFQITIVDNVLTIAVDAQEQSTEEDTDWRRLEFRPGGFSRKFELNEGIDSSAINAKYEEGILQLTLPKLEDFYTERQDIVVG